MTNRPEIIYFVTLKSRMFWRPFFSVLLLLGISFPLSGLAQKGLVPPKYLSMVPGVSTRNDVEKLLGRGDPARHVWDYKTSNGLVTVNYSYGDCTSGGRDWATLEWTVESVGFSISDPLPLKKVILDLTKFRRKKEGDVVGNVTYYNDEAGISVVYDTFKKSVVDIDLLPRFLIRKHLACRNP